MPIKNNSDFQVELNIIPVHGDTGFLLNTRRDQENPQPIEAEVEYLVRSSFYAADPIV